MICDVGRHCGPLWTYAVLQCHPACMQDALIGARLSPPHVHDHILHFEIDLTSVYEVLPTFEHHLDAHVLLRASSWGRAGVHALCLDVSQKGHNGPNPVGRCIALWNYLQQSTILMFIIKLSVKVGFVAG